MSLRKVVRDSKFSDKFFSIPPYLRTSWTSHEATDFEQILNALPGQFDPTETVLGFKSVFKKINSDSMNILAIIAVLDNGHSPGMIAKLAALCFQNGVPLIIGRGARLLGDKFGKRRVCCVAMNRKCAGKEGMGDFVSNLNLIASDTKICIEEGDEILEKFREITEKGKPATVSATTNSTNPVLSQPAMKKSKPAPFAAQKSPRKKSAFFSNFD